MREQSGVILYLLISTSVLWMIVVCLLAMKIREVLKKRGQMKALVMDDSGRVREECVLGRQKEILIGKSTPENLVNIDFGGSNYAKTIEEEHASLRQMGGFWYIFSHAENGMVGLKPRGDDTVYKLKREIPYQVHSGDIVYISYEKIVIQ